MLALLVPGVGMGASPSGSPPAVVGGMLPLVGAGS